MARVKKNVEYIVYDEDEQIIGYLEQIDAVFKFCPINAGIEVCTLDMYHIAKELMILNEHEFVLELKEV